MLDSAKIIEFLVQENKSIAIAESLTGGLLCYEFAKVSGASGAFRGGIICYQNEIKIKVLGIDERILAQKSAYSVEVVDLMLERICAVMDSDFAIATSGIAGPSGGSEKMPVGSVFFGVKRREEKSVIKKEIFSGTRANIQKNSVDSAIRLFKASFMK